MYTLLFMQHVASIPNDVVVGKKVIEVLLATLRSERWEQHVISQVHLAFEEALVNAMKHGNLFAPQTIVGVDWQLTREGVKISITDQGKGFDPTTLPACTAPENLETPSGRGVFIMTSFMEKVEYNERGNSVTMSVGHEGKPLLAAVG